MTQPIKILIVDDHRLIRESWMSTLSDVSGFAVTGAAANLKEATDLLDKNPADVILLDINLGEESGFHCIPRLQEFMPAAAIIAVSMHTLKPYVQMMFSAGALGYVSKTSPFEELKLAIRTVHAKQRYICMEVRDTAADMLKEEFTERHPGQVMKTTTGRKALLQTAFLSASAPVNPIPKNVL